MEQNNDWSDLADITASSLQQNSAQSSGNQDIVDLPDGQHKVSVEALYLKRNNKNQPTLVCRMVVLEGQYVGGVTYFNQVLIARDQYDGLRMRVALSFLKALEAIPASSVQFQDFPSFDTLVHTIRDIVLRDGKPYLLASKTNNKGYREYTIVSRINTVVTPQPQQPMAYQQPVAQPAQVQAYQQVQMPQNVVTAQQYAMLQAQAQAQALAQAQSMQQPIQQPVAQPQMPQQAYVQPAQVQAVPQPQPMVAQPVQQVQPAQVVQPAMPAQGAQPNPSEDVPF